ncbi:unnamed protein product [Closterium sp. NIES-53]
MTSLSRSGGRGDGGGGGSGGGGSSPSSRCGAVQWGASGGGQQRQSKSFTPQQLCEWCTSRGGRGGSSGSHSVAIQLGVPGGGLTHLQRCPRETLTPQQLHEWYVQSGASLSSTRCLYVIRTEFGNTTELPRWLELVRQRVNIFALYYDAILTVMYALSASAEGDCSQCVPPDPGVAAASLGASASGTPPGTASAGALQTFTLDSGALRSFFRNSTTLTPLLAPLPVRLADPSGGLDIASSSTVLPCPTVLFGSLSGHHLPLFSANLVSTTALQDAMLTTTTPGGSSLYTLATEPPQVAASAQVTASGQVAASCSCRLLSHQTLLWHHRLGHPSLPRLCGMHSRLLGRERYFLLVVDDYTRYTTVFPLRSKGEDFATASALVAKLLDFAAACRLDYASALVAESVPASPPSVRGECALGTDVLEDRQEDFECLAAAVPCFTSLLLAPEGDPDGPDIPTPCSYAEAITGPYSSQWQAAMDVEMASWKFTSTYVDEVPPPRASIVDGMWIFRVKRPPGSPPTFKARYVARSLSQRQGVDYFQTFSPTPKMTTLRVLLHVAAQRDYELHSLDFSTAFLQGSLHEEIWTTLAALGFAPSTADPSLFLRTDTSLPPFYVLVYVRQCFGFQYSLPRLTPLSTSHSLSAPPSDKSVEPSGPYPELVGCLMYLMTCTRPDLVYPLSLVARYVALSRHQKVHLDATKRVLRYLSSTSGMGLVLGGRGPVVLTGHADASSVDDSATQRSSQGYTFSLWSGSVSWRSTRSSSVLSFSCEAEIYVGAMATQELCWLTYLLTDLGEQPRSPPSSCFALLLLLNGLVTIACSCYRPTSPMGVAAVGVVEAILAVAVELLGGEFLAVARDGCNRVSASPIHPSSYVSGTLVGWWRRHLHEEIWLRHPPGFTVSFLAGTQWSLQRPVYGLRQAPHEWHDTLRTTLAALGFAPSTADPSLFLRNDTFLPPFYVLVYVDDLVFATAVTEALTLVKSEPQKRHTCTDLGELRSYLGLQITWDRARRTITLTQSHMVHQVLQRFGFQFSSPQPTPLSTSHSLSAPPSDESIESSGPYPELVGCLITSGMGLVLGGRGPVVLTGHADASWVDDSATQRSSKGYTFSLGSSSVSWRSTCSSSVLSSSCEAEINAGAMAAQELRWLTYLLTDLGE